MWRTTYVGDPGIGAFALGPGQFQPLVLLDGAVVLQRALVLSLTPAALEVWVGLQAQAAAVPHGPTLVQVHCRDSKGEILRGVHTTKGGGVWTEG